MPTFDFNCKGCTRDFEMLILTTVAEEKPKCPFCKSDRVTKLFPTTPPNVVLNGDGWTGSKIMPIRKENKDYSDL